MRALNIRWLGNLPYTEALTLQKGFHNSVSDIENEEDYLLLLEHNSVITLGRSGNKKNLITNKNKLDELGIEYFETDRGGDITYHGKGQLIGYPIIRLSDPKIMQQRKSAWEKIVESNGGTHPSIGDANTRLLNRMRFSSVSAKYGAGMHPNRELWVSEPRSPEKSTFTPRNKYR